MHIKNFLIIVLLITGFIACNDTPKAEKTESPAPATTSRENLLYTETMNVHNEVMAEMGKLNGYKKQVQQQTDSIRSMLASTDFTKQIAQRIAEDLNSLDVLGKKLQTADSSMNAWMDQFDPDPKMPTSEEKANYFEGQKRSAEAMKKTFFEALEEADRKFGPK